MSAIRTFVVDDEPLARQNLKRLVQAHTGLIWMDEASDGESAITKINQLAPELIFLDIKMPGISGLDVLKHIVHKPNVIFTTAYEQFAVTAFELQAVDYLLKPFGKRRFDKAVQRLLQTPAHVSERLHAALTSAHVTQLFVRERGKLKAVPVDRIIRIQAADDYAEIVTESATHLMSVRMKSLEQRLDPERFVRIHRSSIINMEWVEEVYPCGNGRLEVNLRDGTNLESSRSGAIKLRNFIG